MAQATSGVSRSPTPASPLFLYPSAANAIIPATSCIALSLISSRWRSARQANQLSAFRSSSGKSCAATSGGSGCRPAELRQGVTLSITDGRLRVDIHSAKVGPDRGQEHRSFEYALPSTYAPINDLANFVDHAGGTLVVSIKNPSSFSSAVVYYGQQAFPRSTKRITPYSMRHNFASDLKLNCRDPDDVSRALGHRADRTRSSYGQVKPRWGGRVGCHPPISRRRMRSDMSVAIRKRQV